MEITKEHVGKVIFAAPTGNAARNWDQELEQFEVIKIKRKYVELKKVAWNTVDNYCPKSGATQGEINRGFGNNSGYRFYETEEEYQKDKRIYQKCRDIVSRARDWGFERNLSKLPEEDLNTVKEIFEKADEL